MTDLDPAGEVRAEDAFDVAAVASWLGTEVPEVRQFPAGVSNLTYLLTYPDRELILRWLTGDERVVFGGTPISAPPH